MKCPECGEWVPATQNKCPTCEFDLSLLHAADALRTAVHRTRIDFDNIASQIQFLESQASSLEELIASMPAPPSAKPPPTDKHAASNADAAPPVKVDIAEAHPSVESARERPFAPPRFQQLPKSVLSRESEIQLGQKWLLIAGIAITVLAVGYFLKYSFDRNWVGPAGRVSLAYLAGLAALGAGEFLRRRGLAQFGLYLIGGSIAVLYSASYAAFQIYELIGQPIAFGLMVIVTFFAGLLALFYDTKWLAVIGIVGGFMTPVVLSTGIDNQIALMSYMVILNSGILAIASFKQWHQLNYLGMSFTWLLFAGWYARHYSNTKFWTTTVFINAFFLTYACVPFVYYFVRRNRARVASFAITVPNAFVAFGYSFATIDRYARVEMVAIVTVAYAAFFFSMATFLYRKNRENFAAFVLVLTMGLLFLVLTVPILFSAHWITLFWAIQGVVLMWAALRLADTRIQFGSVLLLCVAAGKLFFYDYPEVFGFRSFGMSFRGGFSGMLVERWVTVGISVASLAMAGRMLALAGFIGSSRTTVLAGFFFAMFGVSLFAALNIEVGCFFREAAPGARFASISVLWALFAAVLMVLGFAKNQVVLRRVALGLFAATVLKVFLRDMARVETPYRILSFLVLGLLLVAVSYLYHRFAAQIRPASDEEAKEA